MIHENSAHDNGPDISIIIINYNTSALLPRLFRAIADGQGTLKLQIIVIDNASSDDSVEKIKFLCPHANLIASPANVGFGRANNQALELASGKYVLLLNTDAFISPDTLQKTFDYMDSHPSCGVLGVKLVGEDGSVQPSCRFFPSPLGIFLAATGLASWFPHIQLVDNPTWDPSAGQECDWVPGCYYLVRWEVIDRIGLFDPRYFLYYEEVDHCRRVKAAGWTVEYYPDTTVVHIGGQSAEALGQLTESSRQLSSLQIESELLYFRKYEGWSGLACATIFQLLGEIAIGLRATLRERRMGAILQTAHNVLAVIKILGRTHFGSAPTR